MQIELNNIDPNINRIIAYSDDYFKLANKVIHSNLVISKDNLCEDLLTDNFQDFALQHLKKIMLWKPELILIGTGKLLNYPNEGWVDYANKKNIGLEIMSTGAACRSYNLLIDEGRNVVACLFLTKKN